MFINIYRLNFILKTVFRFSKLKYYCFVRNEMKSFRFPNREASRNIIRVN